MSAEEGTATASRPGLTAEEKDRILHLYQEKGKTPKEIADIMDVKYHRIYDFLRRGGHIVSTSSETNGRNLPDLPRQNPQPKPKRRARPRASKPKSSSSEPAPAEKPVSSPSNELKTATNWDPPPVPVEQEDNGNGGTPRELAMRAVSSLLKLRRHRGTPEGDRAIGNVEGAFIVLFGKRGLDAAELTED